MELEQVLGLDLAELRLLSAQARFGGSSIFSGVFPFMLLISAVG